MRTIIKAERWEAAALVVFAGGTQSSPDTMLTVEPELTRTSAFKPHIAR